MGVVQLIISISFMIFFVITDCKVSYQDVHVFQIKTENQKQVDKVKALRDAYPTDHSWRRFRSLNLAYSKDRVSAVREALKRQDLPHKIVTQDLQGLINAREKDSAVVPARFRRGESCKCCNDTMFAKFHRYSHITDWLKFLVDCKSGDESLNLKTFDFGSTFEGRPLLGIEIGGPAEGAAAAKPTIWIHANEHAREWLAGSTAIYIIDRLVNDEKYKPLVDAIHWLIVPIENPDGYEYTHNKDRLWRKNRNPTYGKNSTNTCDSSDCKEKACIGVDLNRNWDARWSSHVDTSQDPCEYQVYDGPSPFSEPESYGARDKIKQHIDTMGAFFSLHTFGQLWLVPYSFSGTESPPDIKDVMEVGKEGAKIISAVHNENYTAGISPVILYAVSGSGMDWAKLNGVKYSYTLELRPHDDDPKNDGSSFVASSKMIIPTGEEVIAGIEHVAKRVIKEWKEKHPQFEAHKTARLAKQEMEDASSNAQTLEQ